MNEGPHIIVYLFRRLGVFLLALLLTYVLATFTATWSVVISLRAMSVEVPISTALQMAWQDLFGMADMFLPMIAFALLIAFMSTAILRRFVKKWPLAWYALAGAVALVCIHIALKLAFGITPLAVGRSIDGLAQQALAGALGGLFYGWITLRQMKANPI